jgi:hypothetical protein
MCGRWGIEGATYRGVAMTIINSGPICELCIDKLIRKIRLDCKNKIIELEMIKLEMEDY